MIFASKNWTFYSAHWTNRAKSTFRENFVSACKSFFWKRIYTWGYLFIAPCSYETTNPHTKPQTQNRVHKQSNPYRETNPHPHSSCYKKHNSGHRIMVNTMLLFIIIVHLNCVAILQRYSFETIFIIVPQLNTLRLL